jgi:outer membrane protein assembly factor BamB
LGYQNITCFDKLNGKIIWNEKLLNDNSLRGLFVNEKIAIVVFNEKVTILDASTGKKIKEYTDKIPGGVAPTFTEYKNTVYFVSQGTGILFAFDATTGERKWTLDSPDKKIDSGYFFDRFVIDPTTDKMYIFNYKNLLCYQLPK